MGIIFPLFLFNFTMDFHLSTRRINIYNYEGWMIPFVPLHSLSYLGASFSHFQVQFSTLYAHFTTGLSTVTAHFET